MGRGTLRVSLPGEWSPNRPREGEFAVAPARSIHRDRASNGDAVHPQRPAQLCRRARFRWSSDLSFDALRCRPLRCVGILNGMTAKYATLQNCISAAQRGILTSREVSGGGLAHQGHTPSTSGSRPSRGVYRALSSANVRSGQWTDHWWMAVGEGCCLSAPAGTPSVVV